jgi:hypothetical protein
MMTSGSWRRNARRPLARHRVLDRILDRRQVDDVAAIRADAHQEGVERARLARAGRSGDEHHAVRPGQERRDQLVVDAREPQALEVHQHLVARQHAHHRLLAPHRRQRRDPQVDDDAGQVDLEAPVLGRALLVDAQAGQHLDARGQRLDHGRAHRHHLVQHAVDAVADHRLELERLDVDVGRARHRRELEDVGEHVGGHRFLLRRQCGGDALAADAPAELLDELGMVEQLCAPDRRLGAEPGLDLAVGQPRHLADGLAVARVHHRDVDGVRRRGVGGEPLGAGRLFAHEPQRLGLDVADLQIDERHTPGAPDLLEQLPERQLRLLRHRPLERDPATRGDADRLLELVLRDELELGDEQIAELAIGEGETGRLHAARSAKNVRTRSTSISRAMFDLMM